MTIQDPNYYDLSVFTHYIQEIEKQIISIQDANQALAPTLTNIHWLIGGLAGLLAVTCIVWFNYKAITRIRTLKNEHDNKIKNDQKEWAQYQRDLDDYRVKMQMYERYVEREQKRKQSNHTHKSTRPAKEKPTPVTRSRYIERHIQQENPELSLAQYSKQQTRITRRRIIKQFVLLAVGLCITLPVIVGVALKAYTITETWRIPYTIEKPIVITWESKQERIVYGGKPDTSSKSIEHGTESQDLNDIHRALVRDREHYHAHNHEELDRTIAHNQRHNRNPVRKAQFKKDYITSNPDYFELP